MIVEYPPSVFGPFSYFLLILSEVVPLWSVTPFGGYWEFGLCLIGRYCHRKDPEAISPHFPLLSDLRGPLIPQCVAFIPKDHTFFSSSS